MSNPGRSGNLVSSATGPELRKGSWARFPDVTHVIGRNCDANVFAHNKADVEGLRVYINSCAFVLLHGTAAKR